MTMLLSRKYEIFPTKEQKETLDRWLQYCRETYNSALLDKQRKYKENNELYTRSDMQKQQTMRNNSLHIIPLPIIQ
ncbi:helix-turn-helix domain-containing protein [Bacillus pseudomycoides]|uniref:helix-turn-helix domain-containing protein n=1 Tax=Bacillus pseudomycoides TaxID=64104 RepID=UPI001FB1FC95|nr:helix-turn-helix domain-containing protein [Bacillus pseudomycoides]